MRIQLEDSLGRMVELLDALGCGVMLLSSSGVIQYANGRLCEMLGRPYATLAGQSFRELYAGLDSPAQLDHVFKLLEAGLDQEFYLPIPGGGRRTVQLSHRPIEIGGNGNGEPNYRVVTAVEI